MSRHGSGKRLSVFDRLGPGNDGELTPPSSHVPPPPPPTRHRHYATNTSLDKHSDRGIHNERSQTDDRLRNEKRTSDTNIETRSRKHHVDTSDVSADSRGIKRVLRKELKDKDRLLVKYNRSSSSSEGFDESDIDEKKLASSHPKRSKVSLTNYNETRKSELDQQHRHDEQRAKRKRESLSDGDRESKRIKTDDSVKGPPLDRKEKKDDIDDRSSSKDKSKRRSLVSESLSEADIEKSDINWLSLSKYEPVGKLSFKMSSIQKHCSGAVFAKIGISSDLASPDLFQRVNDSVKDYLKLKYEDNLPSTVIDKPFDGCNLACTGVSHLNDTINNSHFFDIGTCRRALTGSADFMLRKKLQQNEMEYTTANTSNVCFSQFYASSLAIYQN